MSPQPQLQINPGKGSSTVENSGKQYCSIKLLTAHGRTDPMCLGKENRREVYFGLHFLWLACWPIGVSFHGFLCVRLFNTLTWIMNGPTLCPLRPKRDTSFKGFAIGKSLSSDWFSNVYRGFCNVSTWLGKDYPAVSVVVVDVQLGSILPHFLTSCFFLPLTVRKAEFRESQLTICPLSFPPKKLTY